VHFDLLKEYIMLSLRSQYSGKIDVVWVAVAGITKSIGKVIMNQELRFQDELYQHTPQNVAFAQLYFFLKTVTC
jgi:hypothetical protein